MRSSSTIKDVAREAGVSVATVSYVLNSTPGKSISTDTKQRVMEAVKQLKYISNSAAKSLQSNKTGCIGVVFYQTLLLTRYSYILQGISDCLEKSGYSVMLYSAPSPTDSYPGYINNYLAKRIDGIIYVGADGHAIDPAVESMVVEQRIPFVACDMEANRNISSVSIDYFTGAYNLTKLLLEKGVKRFFYTRPVDDNRQEREREQGVKRAAFEGNASLETLRYTRRDFVEDIYRTFDSIKDELGDDCAIINSWSGADQYTYLFLRNLGLDLHVATLAQGDIIDGVIEKLYRCYIPNYKIGLTCADSMLKLLSDPGDITHTIIQPTLTRTDSRRTRDQWVADQSNVAQTNFDIDRNTI